MPTLRLLADDLTGALDSAARFVPLTGPLPVLWSATAAPSGHAAFDSATRDLAPQAAADRVARLAPLLAGGDPAFKKIDSLLRGHVALELAACMAQFDHCILAPAFPFQGRITRDGRQLVRAENGWRDTGVGLSTALHAAGVRAELHDAATDDDLDAIVAAGRRLSGRVLWCGTGGLAGALAGTRAVPCPPLPRPVLALIGSDHPVAAAQLAAVTDGLHRVAGPDAGTIAAIRASLARGAAAVCVGLPDGTARSAATHHIGACFADLLTALGRPGTLVVAGGETLHGLCERLAATHLEVDGEVVPGVPTSRLRGGAWDGQRVVSKSGAFGESGFLARLLRGT
jgi:uncharacterized protein YgbK (DUF1537 family)